jgi:hypothetical protein
LFTAEHAENAEFKTTAGFISIVHEIYSEQTAHGNPNAFSAFSPRALRALR